MDCLYLVDVSYMFFRAYYAISPHLKSQKNLPTNALYGFLNMTLKLLKEKRPYYLVYCFDSPEASFRTKLYPEYKANRGETPEDLALQIPYIFKLTKALGISYIKKPGYEADDIIGSLSDLALKNKLQTVIVSADKDFAQLINEKVHMYDPMKNNLFDEKKVLEKWGVFPSQMIDYLSLVGDSSDNIPGVRGVGAKGAQKLLSEYQSLDQIYQNLDKIKSKSLKGKLEDSKKMAFLSQKLIQIKTDLKLGDLKDFKLQKRNEKDLNDLLDELSFTQFKNKFFDDKNKQEEKTKKLKSILKQKKLSLKEIEKNLKENEEVTIDAFYSGVYLKFSDFFVVYDGDLKKLGQVLLKKKVSFKSFDVKKIWRLLDLDSGGLVSFDLHLCAHLISSKPAKSFDEIYMNFFNQSFPERPEALFLYESFKELEKSLTEKLKSLNLFNYFNEIELPLIPVLYKMEKTGILVDQKELIKQNKEVSREIEDLKDKIFKDLGEKFNLESSKQLGVVLFEKLKLPVIKKTKTSYSTDREVLLKLSDKRKVCLLILEFRELTKLKSSYLDKLPLMIDPKTKRIHSFFDQSGTTTGRLSSNDPNLQNIPIRTEKGKKIRSSFIAQKDHLILSLDYSQIELRVLAHLSEDPDLIKCFEKDLDVHEMTAKKVFGLKKIDSEHRRKAKAINFGLIYGQGSFGLSSILNIPRVEAKKIIEDYFPNFLQLKLI